MVEAGGDLQDAARATVGGVVSGVAATGGDVAAATRDAAYKLVSMKPLPNRISPRGRHGRWGCRRRAPGS